MPVLRFSYERLRRLTGVAGPEELEDVVFRLKGELEWGEAGYVYVELNPDRPDMYVGEGFARAARGLLGVETGYARPETVDSGVEVVVGEVPQRPYIAAAVVYNVNVDEEYLEELIQFQEKLHDTLGRRRRKAAIGFHDLSKLPSRRIEYRLVDTTARMKPLHHASTMSVGDVLRGTEQGMLYGSISLREGRHPALVAGGEIIAIPPVINSDVTRVEPGTRDLFIDVTGTDEATVSAVLEVIVSGLAERPGARVGLIRLVSPRGSSTSPRLEVRALEIKASWASRILGVQLGARELARLLERARHNVEVLDDGDTLRVEVPPYRVDILGPVDLAEDAAMMMGYEALDPRPPSLRTRGGLDGLTLLARTFKALAVGLGFTESMQLLLTSPRAVEAVGASSKLVAVANPVQAEYSVLRPCLAVSLLQTLAANQHAAKPVRVFEVGEVVWREGLDVLEEYRAALAFMGDEASFEDIQAPLYSILRILGEPFEAEEAEIPWAIPGRAARLRRPGGGVIAWLGEVHPRVLEELGLEYPVALAEVSLSELAGGAGRFRTRGRGTP